VIVALDKKSWGVRIEQLALLGPVEMDLVGFECKDEDDQKKPDIGQIEGKVET